MIQVPREIVRPSSCSVDATSPSEVEEAAKSKAQASPFAHHYWDISEDPVSRWMLGNIEIPVAGLVLVRPAFELSGMTALTGNWRRAV